MRWYASVNDSHKTNEPIELKFHTKLTKELFGGWNLKDIGLSEPDK